MKVIFEDNQLCMNLFGERESHLRIIEESLNLSLRTRGNQITFIGDKKFCGIAKQILIQTYEALKVGASVTSEDIKRCIKDTVREEGLDLSLIFKDIILTSYRGHSITPRGLNQKKYIDAIRNNDLVFGIGPAGTGKTYLAMAMAVESLKRKEIEKIILTRPAVESGEKLGFLPGSFKEKVDPYMTPVYDALNEILGYEKVQELISRGVLEVAPLAYMRGRTLNKAFIVLDEAQNTSCEQMKMFLTRLGYHSKAIVNGDITQIDLPLRLNSGLIEGEKILKGIKGIKVCTFDENDVIRHPLVRKIILAYNDTQVNKKNCREEGHRVERKLRY